MRTFGALAATAAILALAACEQPVGLQTGAPAPAAPQAGTQQPAQVASTAPASAPVFAAPVTTYRIARVTPTIADSADVAWFPGAEGSPREVGAFVGSAVIEGVQSAFTGPRAAALEVSIRQFRPATVLERGSDASIHRVTVDFILRDETTGEIVGREDGLFMDLVALVGTAGVIARNAGRTPEVRLSERIAKITSAWAREASCADIACPASVIVAEAAPTPAPAPVTPAPAAPAVAAPATPAPAPVEVAAAPATEAPAAPEAEAADVTAPEETDAPSNLFAAIAAALAPEDAETPAAADAETPAQVAEAPPAPAPAPAPVEAAPAQEAAPEQEPSAPNLFARLFGTDDEAPAQAPEAPESAAVTVAETDAETAPSVAEAETPAPVATAEAETAPAEEAKPEQPNLFALLFGDDEDAAKDDADARAPEAEAETETAAAPQAVKPEIAATPSPAPIETAETRPAPEPVAVAAEPAPQPVFEPAPRAPEASEPAETVIAAAPAPEPSAPEAAPEPAVVSQATAPEAPQDQDVRAGSPFFRSPASTVPNLPQQSLLGRSQRQNDPLRRRAGDVVLEVANLPAYWDGDQTTGGVWVALPYVPAYRRAVVTNPVNGRTVEANLFWRDPQSGGGSTLLSSAAAEALGVQPGQVASLGVKVVAAD